MMTTRYCHKCAAEVTDHGGYCLLGHSLRLASAVEPLGDLKAEVNAVFEEASAEVASALATPEAPASALSAAPTTGSEHSTGVAEDTQTSAVATAVHYGPEEGEYEHEIGPELGPVAVTRPNVWKALEHEARTDTDDPIAAFAPPPRMDWGPEKGKLRLRKGLRRINRDEVPGT